MKRIFVAGHKGMVGSAIARVLAEDQDVQVVTRDRDSLNLEVQSEVESFFSKSKIDEVYLAAAKVGGIYANNTYPAEFIFRNLIIETNVIQAAFAHGVRRLLFLGSSCIYPKLAKQPITEDALMTGKLEPTNEAYAVAKIAGIKLCESYNRQFGVSHGVDYRAAMPTNLYGPGDNYDLQNSHVVPALLRKFQEAKENGDRQVVVWGSGKPRREFLHVDDLAQACKFLLNLDKETYQQFTSPMSIHCNIGCGEDISISELAFVIKELVGYSGAVVFDESKPDGTPRKLLDVSKINSLGWQAKINLKDGLSATLEDYLAIAGSDRSHE